MEAPAPDVPAPRYLHAGAVRWLAGLDTAVAAALIAGSWFCFATWLRGDYWWAPLNVAGALFYGDRAFQVGIGRATLAGASFLLVLYTVLGLVLTRLIPRPLRLLRVLLIGLIGALLWHWAAERWFWRWLHPFARGYFPPVTVFPAHCLFGLALSRFPSRYRALAIALAAPPPPPPLGEALPVDFALPSSIPALESPEPLEEAAPASPPPEPGPAGEGSKLAPPADC